MDESKSWWQSKGVIGGLVAFVAGIAGLFGIGVSEAVQGELTDALVLMAAAGGGLLSAYGRYKADRKIQ